MQWCTVAHAHAMATGGAALHQLAAAEPLCQGHSIMQALAWAWARTWYSRAFRSAGTTAVVRQLARLRPSASQRDEKSQPGG